MGAGGFHGRVRDGIGCGLPAKATRLSNPPLGRRPLVGRWFGGGSRFWCGVVCCPRLVLPGVLRVICGWHDLWMIAMHGGVFRADRAIRTGQLRALPRVHTRPIDVMVYHG